MKATTLPEGWVGNLAYHHREVGPFRVLVRRKARIHRNRRWTWDVWSGQSCILLGDVAGHPDPDGARTAALARLRVLAAEVLSEVGGGEGRALPVLARVFTAYRCEGKAVGSMIRKPTDHACPRCVDPEEPGVDPTFLCPYHEAIQLLGISDG